MWILSLSRCKHFYELNNLSFFYEIYTNTTSAGYGERPGAVTWVEQV